MERKTEMKGVEERSGERMEGKTDIRGEEQRRGEKDSEDGCGTFC